MKMNICKIEDDTGQVCNQPVKLKQWKRDGMCSRCAELLWANHVQPMMQCKEAIPIIFDKANRVPT